MTASRRVLRDATWDEVAALFHVGGGLEQGFNNARRWAERYGLEPGRINSGRLRLEAWSAQQLAAALDEMAKVEPRMTVDMVGGVNKSTLPPRVDGLPAVVVDFGDGRLGMIDGKHRSNRWKMRPGEYAVLVIEC